MEQALKITDINTEDVDQIWPHVASQLESALDRSQGEYTLEDIKMGLLAGFMRLWIVYDKDGYIHASGVCEIRKFPNKTICYAVLMGGQGMLDWFEQTKGVEDWALENGADMIMAYTRRGVAKYAKELGYKEVYTVIQKELTAKRLH